MKKQSGSEWWAKVSPALGDDYTREVVEAIRNGMAVFDWQRVIVDGLEFFVMKAPLAIGTTEDHVFALGLSAEAGDIIADAFEETLGESVMYATPDLYDAATEHASHVQIGPYTQTNGAAGMTKSAAGNHSRKILAARPSPCSLITGACKTYVLSKHRPSPRGIRKGYACEYGWRLPGRVGWGSKNSTSTGWVVQSAQWAHGLRFHDYSMGIVFVRTAAKSHGRVVDLRAHLSGSIPFVRHPESRGYDGLETGPITAPSALPYDVESLRKGSTGPAVVRWQEVVMAAGFDLAPYGADGGFGKLTHNATVGWEALHGMPIDGVVDAHDWLAVGGPVIEVVRDLGITDTIPCKNFTWADRKRVDHVVIHTMEAAESSVTARNVARWGAGTNAPKASWHYAIDNESTILCVPEEHVAWAAPGGNRHGIQIEMAGYARQTLAQWSDPYSSRMLERVAFITARACERWNIPIQFVGQSGLVRRARGITTHHQISKAFGKSTHSDPGRSFPMSTFLEMIEAA